jgi:hypothetical protein
VQTTDALVSGFEKATGITVNVRSDDEDTLADDIAGEGSRSPADVIYTGNSQVLEYLQSKGLLGSVNAPTLKDTPSQYNSPQGDWIGVSARLAAPGLAAAFCLVFLSVVTELTATLLLIPTGAQTLSTQFWAYESNLSYGQAAPFALVMIAIAAVPSYVLGRFFNRSGQAEGMIIT